MRKLLFLLIVTWSFPAFAQDHFEPPNSPDLMGDKGLYDMAPQLVVKGDRIVATRPNGKVAWAIQHLSVNRDAKTDEVKFPIVGPVEFDGATMYAIRGDLLTLDTKAGRIVERQQYPTLISDLTVDGDKLIVELDIGTNLFGETTKVPVDYKPGYESGRMWDRFAAVAMRVVADVPSSLQGEEKFAEHEGKWTAERKILKMAEDRDPTNPMLPAYRGLAAHADGDSDVANSAFAKAIVAAQRWHEKLLVCGVLERAQRPGLAESTCAAAKEAMAAAGIRPEAMLSLVAYVVLMQNHRLAMKDALAREDLDSVHRLANTTYEMFPNVEAGFIAFRQLSEWFADHGDADRAKLWRERSDEVMDSPVTRSMWGRARTVDHWLLLLFALFLALPISGFALGLRREADDAEPSRWAWLPRPTMLDGLVVAAMLLLILPLSVKMMTEVAAIGHAAEAPIASMHEGYGSPDVIAWAERLPESPSRDEVLAFARHEQEMVKDSKPITMDPPSPMDPLVAIEEMAEIRGREDALSLALVSQPADDLTVPNATPFTFPGALVFFVFAIAGRKTRRAFPEKADKMLPFVPGAYVGFFAPVVVTAMLAGALYLLTPIGTTLQTISVPAFGRYFGMGALEFDYSKSLYPIDRIWPWVALLGGLAVHVVSVVIARRRADS